MLLLALALLPACTTEPDDTGTGKDTSDTAETGDTDTGDTSETGDTAGDRRAPTDCVLAAMTPVTVSSGTTTEVTWTLECADYGDAATGEWTYEYPGLGEAAVTATVDDRLHLTGVVGGRVTLGRTLGVLRFGGAEVTRLPVRVHQPSDVAIDEIARQAPGWNAYDGTCQEMSDGRMALDLDDDGVLDTIYGVGIDDAGRPTIGLADVTGGTCTTHTGDAVYDPASDSLDAVYTSSSQAGGVVATAILWRMRKRPELLYQEWDNTLSEYVTEIENNPLAMDRALDVNPLFDAGAAFLGVVEGGFGFWDGESATTVASYAGVAGVDVGSGLVDAGLYATLDPRVEGAPLASELRAWVLDGRVAGKGLPLELHVVAPATGARYRTTSVGTLPFTPEALTAEAFDLDEDGTMDLVVEAWGEGLHAAFWVPNADDKSESRPAVELVVPADGTVAWSSPDGEPAAVRSSFRLAGGVLVAEELRPSPVETVHVARVWSAADVVAGDGEVRESHRVGATPRTDDCGVVCGDGSTCGGCTGDLVVPVGGIGTGPASATQAELVVGDLVAVAPGGDQASTVVTRAVFLDDAVQDEVVALDPDTCEPATLSRLGGGTLTISGGSVVLSDESTTTISGGSFMVSTGFGAAECTGACTLEIAGKGLVGRWTFDDSLAQDFRVIGATGAGEPVVSWTDPEGLAWAGVADAAVLAAGTFKGRGPIQLTGRANYAAAGSRLALDAPPAPTFTPGEAATLPTDFVVALRAVDTGGECPYAATVSDLADSAAAPLVLSSSADGDCAELYVPLATLRGVPGASAAVLLAHRGSVRVDVLADGRLHGGAAMPVAALDGVDPLVDDVRVSTADLDGDGIEDVLLDAGLGTVALFSDGAGGFTELDVSGELANTLGPVGAGFGLGSCVDVEGGTPGWVATSAVHDERTE